MPHTGPITMSFSKSIGTYELITDGRALLSSEATAVQMELLYSLSMINNTVNNTVRLDWASLTTVTSKVTSSMQFALEYGKIHYKNMHQISVIPGFCSLKTSLINGSLIVTIGNLQRLRPKPQSLPGGAPRLEWVRERHSEFLTHWGLSQNVIR